MSDAPPQVPATAMVVFAHPDDAEFTSAGTIAAWTQSGCQVDYVVCTNGNKGTKSREMNPHRLAEMREEEQQAAARVVGVRQVVFLRANDGELEVSGAYRNRLAILMRHLKPQVVLTHDPWRLHQIHPDHRATGTNTLDAVVYARDHLFLPELLLVGLEPYAPSAIYLFGTDHPDQFIDITDTIDRKLEALRQHQTQVAHIQNLESRVREWASLNGEKAGTKYAEGFKKIVLL